MDETPDQVRYRANSMTLAAIGEYLARTTFDLVEVRLPRELADLASAAWEWDDSGTTSPESLEQRLLRGDAADLALIGLSIEANGRVDGDGVIVALDPTLLGAAVRAADRR